MSADIYTVYPPLTNAYSVEHRHKIKLCYYKHTPYIELF